MEAMGKLETLNLSAEPMQETALDNELVSVIAAAVAMLSVQHGYCFVVRNITRVGDTTPIWCMAGRQQLMQSRSRWRGGKQ